MISQPVEFKRLRAAKPAYGELPVRRVHDSRLHLRGNAAAATIDDLQRLIDGGAVVSSGDFAAVCDRTQEGQP
jgi:hypothetical protein